MNIVQITPGAGGMFCGNCFHDNTLVAELRKLGHDAVMLPLYLPINVDTEDQSAGNPIFFSGVNVYLQQKSAFFRHAPKWLHRLLSSRGLLARVSGRAAQTRPGDVGDLLMSMLRGEHGNQNREITELIAWLRDHAKPDVICLSNALLIGMARRMRAELGVPVVCLMQGEEPYLDALPDSHRDPAWRLLAERAVDIDAWIAPSRWNADRLIKRLNLRPERVHVVPNGIEVEDFQVRTPGSANSQKAPVLGYFARMCQDKGLHLIVDAYIHIKNRGNVPRLKLHIGGGCGPSDEPLVKELRARLAQAGYIGEVSFSPNVSHAEKVAFLSALTVFSVPAHYGEVFGLYLVEAMAAGVPVVQPRTAAFPEIIAASGAGVLCEPNDATALGEAIEGLLLDSARLEALSKTARQSAIEKFSAQAMARNTLRVFEAVTGRQELGAIS